MNREKYNRLKYLALDRAPNSLSKDEKRELRELENEFDETGKPQSPPDPDTRGARASANSDSDVNAWLRGGDGRTGREERSFTLADSDAEFRNYAVGPMERRDNTSAQSVSITGGSAGGYTVPVGFWENLQVALRAYGGLWSEFKLVRTETGQPMSWPTINRTNVYGTLLTEDTQITPSSDYVFGLGVMNAWTVVAPLTLATIQLEEDSAFSTAEWVGQSLGEAVGRELAALAWSGTGSSQPLGLTTALAAGSSITPGTGTGSGSSGGGYLALAAANAVKLFSGSTTELIANTLSPQTLINMIEAIDPAYLPTRDTAKS
jgi:HK97 family phage major capsid protein